MVHELASRHMSKGSFGNKRLITAFPLWESVQLSLLDSLPFSSPPALFSHPSLMERWRLLAHITYCLFLPRLLHPQSQVFANCFYQ